MDERSEYGAERHGHGTTVIELILREPEIVAWLEDERLPAAWDAGDDDHEPPAAA